MQRIWAPWRLGYILSEKEKECLFCRVQREQRDQKNFILHRGQLAFVIINLYPYNNGHLMIAPYQHIDHLGDLTNDVSLEIMQLLRCCEDILNHCYQPEGLNVGLNLGQVAGAGIIYHLHFHILPRWNGDTNFMGVLGNARVIPESPQSMFKRLKPSFDALTDHET